MPAIATKEIRAMPMLQPGPARVLLDLADHPEAMGCLEYDLDDFRELEALEREQEALIAWLKLPGSWLPPYARLPPPAGA